MIPRVITEQRLTKREAAELCGVHLNTITNWISGNWLESAKYGGKVVTSVEAIARMHERRNEPQRVTVQTKPRTKRKQTDESLRKAGV